MNLEPAPILLNHFDVEKSGSAFWTHAGDGTRLRIAFRPGGEAGTILIFPGRTEYIEKYAETVADLGRRGFAVATIDWRGQGLSDRICKIRGLGHVGSFDEYQQDADAFRKALEELGAPAPRFILGHSMGGCIGLRSIQSGPDASAAAFTGPMWGLPAGLAMRSVGRTTAWIASLLGLEKSFVPGSDARNYVQAANPKGNSLTSDAGRFEALRQHLEAFPELSLGGPSLGWLRAALNECSSLKKLPPPGLPALVLVGSDDTVVSTRAIFSHCNRWRRAELELVHGARHEILMEIPAIRSRCIRRITEFFMLHGHEDRNSSAAS